MYAIVKVGGKQYRVEKGDSLLVDRMPDEEGAKVALQPLMYRGGALKVNPVVAIVAILVGANLAGVLGALLAIPTAASLGVILDEFVLSGSASSADAEPEGEAVA